MLVGPQAGPQDNFMSTKADIAIYGGAAGGGKTYALLLEPLRHIQVLGFGGTIFRRIGVQIVAQGGLWDESNAIFPLFGSIPLESKKTWVFKNGNKIKFSHLEHEKTKYNWQGAQIPYIGFDELTHFTESQFFYLIGRNRSTCGVPGYIRATCNPDADSWVATFIEWWIDQETGLAIPERAGKLRYFIRQGDKLIWGDSREALILEYGAQEQPKSVTFIPASVHDNKILLEKDPSYLGNLMALSRVDRERLLGGNWKIRPAAGLYFKRHYFKVVEAVPQDPGNITVRCWDKAGTEKTDNNNPDWTAGCRMTKTPDNRFYIEDVRRARVSPFNVETMVVNTAAEDGRHVEIGNFQDPGSAGKMEAQYYSRQLAGYNVRILSSATDKITNAKPLSSQAEAGNVYVVQGKWNKDFFDELENFPEGPKKDQVDAASGAFNMMTDSAGHFTPDLVPPRRSMVKKGDMKW